MCFVDTGIFCVNATMVALMHNLTFGKLPFSRFYLVYVLSGAFDQSYIQLILYMLF